MTKKMASQSSVKFSDYPVQVQVSEEGSGWGKRSAGLYPHHHK